MLGETLTIDTGSGARKVVFEDLDFTAEPAQEALLSAFSDELAELLFPGDSADDLEWRQSLKERLCLVHDDVMSFLLETAMEVNAHIRLDSEAKTVQRGGLWYQESLPAESVLAGIAVAAGVKAVNGRSQRTAADLLGYVASLTAGLVQLGGKATVGQGSCFVRMGGRP